MSAWTPGGDSTGWSYQAHAPPGPHLHGEAFPSQPSASTGPSIDQWGQVTDYGQAPSHQGYTQVEYGNQGPSNATYQQYSDGQINAPPPAPSPVHQPQSLSYSTSNYPHYQQQQTYPNVSQAPPAPSNPYLENPPPPSNSSLRYGPSASDPPVPPQAGVRLSVTAQRFQNAASPLQATHQPSTSFSQPPPSQVPPRNFPSNPRQTPSPASVQQYHRKVDELAILEHRLSQLQNILTRGTMAETGQGSNQPILANQRAHLEQQVREFKNRQVNLLNECDAFTQHFGPASAWDNAPSPLNPTARNPAPPPLPPPNRGRAFSSTAQSQMVNHASPQQYAYDLPSNGNAGQPAYVGGGQLQQSFPNPHDRQLSSNSNPNSYESSLSHGPNGRPPPQQASSLESWRPPPGNGIHSEVVPASNQNSFAPYPPQQQQRFNQSPHPGQGPSYTHLPAPTQPERYASPSQQQQQMQMQPQQARPPPPPQQQRQPPPPSQYPSNPPPQNPSHFASYPPPPNQPQNSMAQPNYHQPEQQQQNLHPFPTQQPHYRTSPSAGPSSSSLASTSQQQIPSGLRAQMDALARDQASQTNTGGTAVRGPANGNGVVQNPLQVLIRKAENGEMPVMTMSGLRKQSEVEREKKQEEEREKARNAKLAEKGASPNGVSKSPTSLLADLCRQGGGPTLAEMVMTIDHQLFWSQLQQTCSKRNVNVFDEVHQGNFVVEGKTIDLLQLFQTVVSRGGGHSKIDAGNAWPHVATLLSISTRSPLAQARIKEIYHRILTPFEDVWANQMIKLREKQRAMDEARRVLGAVPAAASSATASPRQSNSHESSPLPPQQPVPSPLATTTHLAPTNQSARRSPSQPAIPPAPGSSSMFANPISYNSLPPSNAYSSNPAANFPLAPSQPSGSSAPTEKPVTSADLLEQARALRRNATATAQKSAAPGGGGAPQTNSSAPVQPPPTTSPPQETSSTPQESVTASIPAPAPVVEAFSKPKSPSTATSNLSAPPDGLQPAIGTNGNNSAFSTSPSHLGLVLARNEHKRNVTESRKRKNDEVDTPNEAAKSRTRTRDRSMSNLEAPVVGQQTNEPHFNPFEITHFLPFTTAAPSIVPSPTTSRPPVPVSDSNDSVKSTLSNPSLRPDTSSTSAETVSPQSIGDGAVLPSPGTKKSNSKSLLPPDNVASNPFDLVGKSNPSLDPPLLANALDPSSFDSISLSVSLDPHNMSRPGTSWSLQDSSLANGLSTFDSFGTGLDGFDFSASSYDHGLDGLGHHQPLSAASLNGAGLPNWSPGGLDGFDFNLGYP